MQQSQELLHSCIVNMQAGGIITCGSWSAFNLLGFFVVVGSVVTELMSTLSGQCVVRLLHEKARQKPFAFVTQILHNAI